MRTTSATELRKSMKTTLDIVSNEKEIIIIHRPNEEDVVMMSLSEYNSWIETRYLLSTKNNREHLTQSIEEIDKGETTKIDTSDLWK
ncbi:MAG: type II toxin-antitoxin system Phd/YefM family antitoxin [Bacteroidetes bacterium]|nr:type II toxin-antitoxin system Phd/YefM family antitoxin [Bacteroidota bacterium]